MKNFIAWEGFCCLASFERGNGYPLTLCLVFPITIQPKRFIFAKETGELSTHRGLSI